MAAESSSSCSALFEGGVLNITASVLAVTTDGVQWLVRRRVNMYFLSCCADELDL